MPRDARFWRNVTIIGLAHIAILLGLIRWSRENKKPSTSDIVWMAGGAGETGEAVVVQNPAPATLAPNEPEQTPQPTPEPSKPEAEEQPSVAPAKSELQLPTPTPVPAATPTPKPTETPTPVTAKATPKPTPKPTPKAKPKSTPKKTVVAKATPKPTAKPKEDDQTDDAEARKKEIAKAALAKKETSDADGGSDSEKPVKKATAANGSSKLGAPGAGGHGSGAGGASEFGWYGNMLHDRFYSEWAQPMTVVASGAKLSALVKLRIEKDGRVSEFTIIKPSGNVVVDESVAAVAKRVTQVDPLPAGLGGDYYEVKINFELNPEE